MMSESLHFHALYALQHAPDDKSDNRLKVMKIEENKVLSQSVDHICVQNRVHN